MTPAPMIHQGHLIGVTLWIDDPAAVDALIAYAGATEDRELLRLIKQIDEERRKEA